MRLGIHPRTLYSLRDAGDIEQVGRGLYRLSTAPPLSSPDLVPIAIRFPRAVVCLVSALAHHGLTTQVPHTVDIALPSHAQVPKVDGVPLQVFWYPESSFRAGVDLITVDDVPMKVYSPEKTIADCFKYWNKIGLDIAIEALRAYRERTRKPNKAADQIRPNQSRPESHAAVPRGCTVSGRDIGASVRQRLLNIRILPESIDY
jgi:predicted transcriptional regulator of viral defense system